MERIESIYSQTFSEFELIVIDDCSVDGSDKILQNLQGKKGFTYIRNIKNTGTPFSAWEKICSLAKGKFIWICESDDVAEPTFLEIAVNRLQKNDKAAIFYSNSNIINGKGEIVGNTKENYFHKIWKEVRWDQDFSSNGMDELRDFQIRGQIVPNMSSSLIAASAFKAAYDPFLRRLKLTGDWLFVGKILRHGDVEFSSLSLNNFREHEQTARVRVRSALSQAEFIITKFHLFKHSNLRLNSLAPLMSSDAVRFLYEPASFIDLLKALFSISIVGTFELVLLMSGSVTLNAALIGQFISRYAHAKKWRKNEFN